VGSPLADGARARLAAVQNEALTERSAWTIQEILDPYVLAFVETRRPATPTTA
jgi:hypothetical protein